MKISKIAALLDAKILTETADADREVHTACGSDMMSDVLAYVKNQAVLLTGLNNPQVIRTADMMDMQCVVFVRGKTPDEAIIQMGEEKGIVLMTTGKTMFHACGILYSNGLMEDVRDA